MNLCLFAFIFFKSGETNMESKRILPITCNKDTQLSFHLSAVLSDDMKAWFYNRFINIRCWGIDLVVVDFMDNVIDDSYRDLFDERICYDPQRVPNGRRLIKSLKRNLCKDFYSYLWIDKYEIPGSDEYHISNFIHPILIYGYDDASENFFIENFTPSKGSYLTTVHYSELCAAYDAVIADLPGLQIANGSDIIRTDFRLNRQKAPHRFDIVKFTAELSNYIFSRPDVTQYVNSAVYFGMDVYKSLLRVCDEAELGTELTFKSLHDLELHKQFILERLSFVSRNYLVSSKFMECVDKYCEVVRIYRTIVLTNIKFQMREKNDIASFSTNPIFIEKMRSLLLKAQRIEKECLISVYSELIDGVRYIDNIFCKNIVECTEYKYTDTSVYAKTDSQETFQAIEIIDTYTPHSMRSVGTLVIRDPLADRDVEITVPDSISARCKQRYISIPPQKISSITYSEMFPASTGLSKLRFRLVGINRSACWDFTNLDQSAWTAEKHIDCIIYDNGLKMRINGNEARLSLNLLKLDAQAAKYVRIRYSNHTNSEIGHLFFATYSEIGLSVTKSKTFTIDHIGETVEYVLDMSENSDWNGIIKNIRFDPVGFDNSMKDSICVIESIRIDNEMPKYDSVKHYSSSQGVNGWFYYVFDGGTTYREMNFDAAQEKWIYPNCPGLFIDAKTQNAFEYMATVRRWVCQATGTYTIDISTDFKSNYLRYAIIIKQNQKVITAYQPSEAQKTYKITTNLEYGENINIEVNYTETTTDSISLIVHIEKVS